MVERYYLVNSPNEPKFLKVGWSEEENSTIKNWKWLTLEDMLIEGVESFKPNWLPELLSAVLDRKMNTKQGYSSHLKRRYMHKEPQIK
jgi:hypothetical protein